MKNILSTFIILILISMLLVLIFNGNFETNTKNNQDVLETKAKVIKVDNSNVIEAGISKIGDQKLLVEIVDGKYKEKKIDVVNHLIGKLELDNYYNSNDDIIIAVQEKNSQIKQGLAVDLYRQNWELVLFLLFILSLLVYAGITGLKAVLSFVASLFIILKILIPQLLKGENPLILSGLILIFLSAIIIFSIGGFTKKGVVAFLGTIIGLFVTIGITLFFGDKISLDGSTMPYIESLLFSGHLDLNIKYIFYSAIIIGASGAAMDIAMDISASMHEIKIKKPEISLNEHIKSGFNIGRSVIGTMTTTLLLAYSGGYITLLMLFYTKNSSLIRIINLKIISAEIMRTVVGSIGLVLIAPITAIIGGVIFNEKLFNIIFKRFKPLTSRKLTSDIIDSN